LAIILNGIKKKIHIKTLKAANFGFFSFKKKRFCKSKIFTSVFLGF